MCHGNLAEASRNYINHQLHALWENSKACAEKSGHQAVDEVVKRGIAFREFHGPEHYGKRIFHAVFQKPTMKFLCGHELILKLHVEDCTYQYHSATRTVQNLKIAMVLSYKVEHRSVSYGGPSRIGILVIDPDTGKFFEKKKSTYGEEHLFDALKTHYLPMLASDLLNLFVLPASYNDPTMDPAILTKAPPYARRILGVDLEKIHDIFDRRWLAAIDAHTNTEEKYRKDNSRDIYMADYHDYWNPDSTRKDFWANIRLHPMRIKVLCPQEVIVFIGGDIYLQGEEHHVEDKESHTPHYKNWKLAVIFEVYRMDPKGPIYLRKPAKDQHRIAHKLCTDTKDFNKKDKSLFRCFEATILGKYIDSIFEYGHHHIYPDLPTQHHCTCREKHNCNVIHGPPPPRYEEWPDKVRFARKWPELREEFVPSSKLHGYHRITTVTQDGISQRLESFWDQPDHDRVPISFHSHKYRGSDVPADVPHFDVKLRKPKVELIVHKGSKSILIYFDIERIKFALNNKEYKKWILAVRFDLKLIKDVEKRKPAQLVLDTKSAKFIHDRSFFPGLVDTDEPLVTRDLYETIGINFVGRYLPAFFGGKRVQRHVLCELPIHSLESTHGTHNHGYDVPANDIGFTIVPFYLPAFDGNKIPERTPHEHTWRELTYQGVGGPDHHIVERNMIVFHAATGDNTSIYVPVRPGPYGAPSDAPTIGTLLLSREVFLDAQIIKPLWKANALSALLCTMQVFDHRRDEWTVNLASWNKHSSKLYNEEDCQWEPRLDLSNNLERAYTWESQERWNYDANGKGTTNATFSVNIVTKNELKVPTQVTDRALVIKLSGSTTITMQYKAHDSKAEWTGELKATWEAPIYFRSDLTNGVSIKIKPDEVTWITNVPKDVRYPIGAKSLEDVSGKFKGIFNKNIKSMSSLLEKLECNGAYHGLNMSHTDLVLVDPVFNANGDLFLQICSQTTKSGHTHNTRAAVASSKGHLNEANAHFVPPVATTKPQANSYSAVTHALAPGPGVANGAHPPANAAPAPSVKSTDGHVQADHPAKEVVDKSTKGANGSVGLVGDKAKANSVNGAPKAAEVTTDKSKANGVNGHANGADPLTV